MSEAVLDAAKLEELGRNSRRAALLSFLGFILILSSMGYAGVKLQRVAEQKRELDRKVVALKASVSRLQSQESDLRRTQIGMLNFLKAVLNENGMGVIDSSVDWPKIRTQIIEIPDGSRKIAVFDALLLSWKNLPFSLANRSLSTGFDSPHLIDFVLSHEGIQVDQRSGERLSDAMMRQFKPVDTPLPGDLIFYRGNVGSFVLMYICPGSVAGKGIAIGTLQSGEEIQVIDTKNINTPVYPFIGYFRVPFSN